MQILVIGPEFLEVEKHLKKIVCVDGEAILTMNSKKEVQIVEDKIIDYMGDDSFYNFSRDKKHPKKLYITLS